MIDDSSTTGMVYEDANSALAVAAIVISSPFAETHA